MRITLEWDYKDKIVQLSMLGYIPKALKRFGHEPPPKLQDKPYLYAPPNYGSKIQYYKAIDPPPL